MKWRSSSSVSFLLFAGLFVSANSSPAGKAASLESAKAEIEKKITPSTGDEGSDDDLLARAKKSSTTTTFCVEIKPGNEQPAVVVCDPSKTDEQVPIPDKPSQQHHPEPAPHYEQPSFPIPSNIPNYLPAEYPRGLMPEPSYEPLIFIPQQPQIIQPQILQPFSPQPQIILLRDPSCPSSNPLIVSNPYATRLFSRSSQYGMMEPTNYLGSGYNGQEETMRSIPASSFGNGYTSPLDLIYSRRGQNPPQNPLANSVTFATSGSPAPVNGNQNFDGQYNRPVLIQCNPKVIPLSQDAYAAATSGKANANDQEFKSNIGTIQGSAAAGHQAQFTYQPGGPGHYGTYPTHEGLHHHQLQHGVNHYHQSNSYPYSNGHYKTTPEFGAGERAAAETGEGVKTAKEMSVQQGQMTAAESFAKNLPGQKLQAGESQHNSQAMFNGQGNRQGSVSGDGRTLGNQEHQQQQKMEVGKLMEGTQNSQNRFPSSSFVQGQTSFANGDRMIPKDQGLQKQMGFSQNQNQNQNQQQQQMMPNAPRAPGMEQKHSGGGDMSYSQMLLQRMKSSVGQGNLVQPFMMPSSGLAGDKQTQLKGQN